MDVRAEQADLTHGVDAPRAARRLVSSILTRWGVAAEVVERAQLLVSELVSNAFMYGHGPIRLAVHQVDSTGAFRVEVCNSGQGHPSVRHPAAGDASGRGLRIVEELARTWGSVTSNGETNVWFEMPANETV